MYELGLLLDWAAEVLSVPLEEVRLLVAVVVLFHHYLLVTDTPLNPHWHHRRIDINLHPFNYV